MTDAPEKNQYDLAKTLTIEVFLGFSFALLSGMAYFGSGFDLEFIYQGF
ncbi:MAG: hypothetical protein KDI90_00170 [Alphaproteobacteria bacterium]|nr:hypothetical protein [Alphaproteobacteria bacterium]MCB9974696.1 hypothetical protein [Rhodospirillales bacterium]